MRKWLLRLAYVALGLAPIIAYADYTATQGAGSTVFAFVCSSTKICPAMVLIDSTNVEKATAGNPLRIDPVGTTAQPVSGTITANAGTNLNTSALATAANQATNGVTTAHTCSVAGYSEIGCLGQIDDGVGAPGDAAWTSGNGSSVAILKAIATNVAASLPTGANVIGGVFGSPNVTPTDCSIALTTGGTAQNIIAASSTIHGFTIANIDTAAGSGEPIWFSLTTTAAASTIASYPLAAPTATTFANLSSYTTPFGFGNNHAVSVVAATTGHKISCTTW